jgi:hypothetical protein
VPVSDRPWSGITAASYDTPAAYCRASLINLNTGPSSGWSKSACKLPVKEPGGAINRAGVHAAAAALAGGRGGVQAPPEAKRAAARRLLAIYRNDLKEDPPESLVQLARG